MALYGYCPLRLVGGTDSEGVPWSVYPLQPSTLSRIDAGRWQYGSEIIPADELRIVRRTLFPGDALTQGIIRLARAQIAASWAGAEYVADWWGNGGAPQVILTTEQQLAKEQAEDIAARWLERRQLGPSHPAVLGMGTSAQSFGADLMTKDAADAQDRIVASLARYFGVPPHMVNAPNLGASLQYSTTESAGLDLVRYTLGSYSQAIGDVMSELLPGDYLVGQQVRIDLSHLTRAEQLSRYQSWQLAIDGGWMTRDEVRAIEGLAPMAEVDELTVAVNAEASAAGEQIATEVMA
jgi:phage portal protein BeeE